MTPTLVSLLQTKLAAFRPIDPANPATSSAPPLAVPLDGVLGASTVSALQTFLGCDVTGVLVAENVRQLQAHVGVTPDGVLGPNTLLAMQAALSAGTF